MYIETDKNDNPRIFMLIGGSFNGKTKLGMKLAIKYDAVFISRSQIKQMLKVNGKKHPSYKVINKTLLHMILQAVGTNRNIVIDGGFTTAKSREQILEILNCLASIEGFLTNQDLKEYKEGHNYVNIMYYSIIGVYIKPNYKLALKRNRKCNYPINVYRLQEQYSNLEKPYKDEGFTKILEKRAK